MVLQFKISLLVGYNIYRMLNINASEWVFMTIFLFVCKEVESKKKKVILNNRSRSINF